MLSSRRDLEVFDQVITTISGSSISHKIYPLFIKFYPLDQEFNSLFFHSYISKIIKKIKALVAWSTVCRPINQGGLGIRHLQHTNMALLTKWVCRMMQPLGDLVTVVLRDEYGSSLDWEMWRTPAAR